MDSIITFINENLILSLIIGIPIALIVLFTVLGWILRLFPDAKVKSDPDFSTDDERANDLALGFIQIRTAFGVWNDPEAREIEKTPRFKKNLIEMWGLINEKEYKATIKRLVTDRRKRELWDTLLAIRGKAAQDLGHKPTSREWIKAIKSEGGSGKGDEKVFVEAVAYYEKELKKINGHVVFPADFTLTTFEGYAFGQAVAVAVWGVAMGYATVEEATETIRSINKIARKRFSSWEEFGRSYIIGRAMHQSEGIENEKIANRMSDATIEYAAALNPKANGPWTKLKW